MSKMCTIVVFVILGKRMLPDFCSKILSANQIAVFLKVKYLKNYILYEFLTETLSHLYLLNSVGNMYRVFKICVRNDAHPPNFVVRDVHRHVAKSNVTSL